MDHSLLKEKTGLMSKMVALAIFYVLVSLVQLKLEHIAGKVRDALHADNLFLQPSNYSETEFNMASNLYNNQEQLSNKSNKPPDN